MADSNDLLIKALFAINTIVVGFVAFYFKNSINQLESIKVIVGELKGMYKLLESNLQNLNTVLHDNKSETNEKIKEIGSSVKEIGSSVKDHEKRIGSIEVTCRMKHDKSA